jgi:glutaconate CoA-transferase subunit B
VVVTDLGVYRFGDDGAMRPASLHPGVTPDQLRDATGWALDVPANLPGTPPPTDDELRLIRSELDPDRVHTT